MSNKNELRFYPFLTAPLLVALLVGGVAVVVSAHGGNPDEIHACVNRNGSIRIVGPNRNCPGRTMPLDWNIQGPPGPAGISGYEVVVFGYTCPADTFVTPQGVLVSHGNTCLNSLSCPAGKVAIGGGYSNATFETSVGNLQRVLGPTGWVVASYPSDASGGHGAREDTAWTVAVRNGDLGDFLYSIYAICADAEP